MHPPISSATASDAARASPPGQDRWQFGLQNGDQIRVAVGKPVRHIEAHDPLRLYPPSKLLFQALYLPTFHYGDDVCPSICSALTRSSASAERPAKSASTPSSSLATSAAVGLRCRAFPQRNRTFIISPRGARPECHLRARSCVEPHLTVVEEAGLCEHGQVRRVWQPYVG